MVESLAFCPIIQELLIKEFSQFIMKKSDDLINMPNHKYKVRLSFLIFLPFLIITTAISGMFFYQELKSKKKLLMTDELRVIELLHKVAVNDVKSIIADLVCLSSHPEFRLMLEKDDPTLPKKVVQFFLTFSKEKALYDQVRFLNETGMEVIRINFGEGQPYVVTDNKLQNKAKRYYFADTFNLEPGQIFVSPLDLNIERGRIEQPLKPMIRFGTPVAGLKGQKRGIVLLNYYGAKLIGSLAKASMGAAGHTMLLNSEGYWLKGFKPEDEWGFMYKNRRDRTLSQRDPLAWQKIKLQNMGQLVNEQGVYTYTTVSPLGHGMLSSSGSWEAFEPSKSKFTAKEYTWKIISFVPAMRLKKLATTTLFNWFPLYGLIVIFLGIISLLVSLVTTQSKQAKIRLKKEFATITTVMDDMLSGEGDGAKTEAQVLDTCLAATDSVYGMIGIVNEHGKYDTTTYSSRTIQDCAFPEALAWELSTGMTIRGIWGYPVLQGKPLLCNDLQTHPDRVGFPEGHVPIRCFLGAPLIRDKKVIGMVAVANKPGGYTEVELETLIRLTTIISISRHHRMALKSAKRTSAELEQLVKGRTSELLTANKQLKDEINERKLAEEALRESEKMNRATFEQAAVGIAHVTIDGSLLRVNQKLCDMMGYPTEKLLRKTFQDITHPDDLEAYLEYVDRLLRGEIATYNTEKRYFRKDGSIVWINLTVSLVRDEAEQPKHAIYIIQDITARKQAEDQVAKSLHEKEILLSEIHHRVKNNMQIVSSLLSLQATKHNDPQIIDTLRETEIRVSSMAFVHEVLYQSENFSSINLQDYFEKLVNNLKYSFVSELHSTVIETHVQGISLKLDHAIPCGLIVTELVTNAIKYAIPTDSNLIINITATDQQNENIRMTISDNGKKLPEKIDPMKTKTLGLQLVTEIVTSQLEGSFRIDQGKGVCWIIEWPV